MRQFHVGADTFVELDALPQALPDGGYLWLACTRAEFEVNADALQGLFSNWAGGSIVDLHVSDLLNAQLPSHFDATSWYDLFVFRRLAAGAASQAQLADDAPTSAESIRIALQSADTSPVGFVVFDRVLLSVHPEDCQVREFFAARLAHWKQGGERRSGAPRLPTSPADLMLRMVNHMVDGYLALRRLLTRQLGHLQHALLASSHFSDWPLLLESRIALHALEDTCEDQRSAIQEWIDALAEWPAASDPARQREHELLRLRSRDVLEHIERVLGHVRRLESSAETAVQMHFSAQGNRTNDIMRTLTVLTAIFLPLNFVTGFFGMNFEGLPLIHSARGFWVVAGVMLLLGVGLASFFWRKRYLRRNL
ncbi:MAG TPA: magnesium transporter CorA family protein [Burkholderiaceae bacterium]|nr:magnesium transporter CorA family protein [Burkholderiaceae bacterium]